jgi:hypothetical protein
MTLSISAKAATGSPDPPGAQQTRNLALDFPLCAL